MKVAICSTLLLLVVLTAPSGASELPPPRTVRVSGESVAKAAPDRVRVAVSVISRAATAGEATQANAAASKAVLEKLRAAVKPPGQVSTAGYDLAPEYDYNRPNDARGGGPVLIGYIATNRYAIVSADLAGVGALIDASVAAGAKQVDSISFFLEDESAPRREALLEAGKKARAEAETIAESLGVSLGEVLDASSVSQVMPLPVRHGRERAVMAMDEAAPQTEMVPGSLDIRGNVTVTYAIR